MTNLVWNDPIKKDYYKFRINVQGIKSSLETLFIFPSEKAHSENKFLDPSLLLIGTQSDYVKKEDIPFITSLFPKAEIEYVDAGHWLHFEAPTQFISLVEKFFVKHYS